MACMIAVGATVVNKLNCRFIVLKYDGAPVLISLINKEQSCPQHLISLVTQSH